MGAAVSELKRVPATLLSCRTLPHADARLCEALGLPAGAAGRSLGLVTCDQDDTLYAALDHATKMSPVEVIYARSFYAGAAHASGPLSGEVLGVIAGDEPEAVTQGLAALEQALGDLFAFYAVGETGVTLFPTVIGRVGRYLAAQAAVPEGSALAYLIAPPVEAMVALDAALKVADVRLARFFGPPSETNFAGAYLTGELHAVEAAAKAFTAAVVDVVAHPRRG
jgi:ethanolamine utilization protein EutL